MQDKSLVPESAWVVNDHPEEQDIQNLRRHLHAYNVASAKSREGYSLAIFLHNKQSQLLAGISGWLWGECLEIDYLWVHETWRGQGIGKRLVRTLEDEAVTRGCRQITLETFSFQAPEFYRHIGYSVFGVISGFGNGHQKFYMQKRLG